MTGRPTFAPLLEGFFTQRLMRQRRASAHTIASYRDTFQLLLRFAHERLRKAPSVSETLDWARTLLLLNAEHLSPDLVRSTLNVILKFEQDIESASEQLPKLLAEVAKAAA